MSGQGFPVNEAEASKVQSSLGSIVDEVLRELLQKLEENKEEQNKDQEQTPFESEKESQVAGIDFDKAPWDVPEIEVWQKGELVYGRTPDTETCNFLDPKTEAKLELAVDLPVGTKVQGLEDTAIIFRDQNDKVTELFKVDKDGVISVNDINQNVNQIPKVEEQSKGNGQESSSERLKNVFAQQKQTPQIQALSQHVAQLQEQIKQQQQFIDQQLKYNKNQQNFNAELLKRVNENQRVQQERIKSRDPNWWQKGINKFVELKEIYQKRRQEQKVAKTLNQLWDKNTKKGAEVYQTDDYTLQKDDHWYILKNKDDKAIFQYSRWGPMDNNILHNELSPQDLSQIEILQERLKNKVIEGKFASVDVNQKRLNEKSQQVVDGFVDIARQQADGKFIKEGSDYSISAKATGEINIWRKNENIPELIYSQSKKGQLNAMNDRDIGVLSKGLDQFKQKQQQNLIAQTQEKLMQSNIGQSIQSVGKTLSRGGR